MTTDYAEIAAGARIHLKFTPASNPDAGNAAPSFPAASFCFQIDN